VRTQLTRGGIYDLEFFFDADSKAVSHGVALRVTWSCWGLRASYHTRQPAKLHLRGSAKEAANWPASNWRWT
jgi:hypothetical protein